ncbi:hypothetical protein [Reticulibacter mediterranei]|uniref:hypothetical protein n=1 Tax=Reticulibacter mediterranei TaxID=2778369 RepID=UPI001C69160F|nr:hypothetical protein [Reticulibacter mediterranei]
MTMPNLDQTEGIWIGRASDQGFHFVQDVFPGDTQREQWHRANCQILIARGQLWSCTCWLRNTSLFISTSLSGCT